MRAIIPKSRQIVNYFFFLFVFVFVFVFLLKDSMKSIFTEGFSGKRLDFLRAGRCGLFRLLPVLPAALVPAESSWLEQLLWRKVRGGFFGAGPVGSGAFKASSILQQSDLHISNLHISDLFEPNLHGVSVALGFLFSVKSRDFGPVRKAGLRLHFI